jgi:hypothetical protein
MALILRQEPRRRQERLAKNLHPVVFAAVVGFGFWMVAAAWTFVGDGGYSDAALAVVTAFLVFAAALPTTLWLVGRQKREAPTRDDAVEPSASFGNWAESEVDVWTGHLKGREAAIMVGLPVAAVAIGMTALAIVVHFEA